MKSAFLGCVLALGACIDQPGDEGVTNAPKLSVNALTPADFAAANLNTATLNSTSAATMGQTAGARLALAYAVGCALNSGTNITYTVGGTQYTASGAMGVAPSWTGKNGLSATDAAWVSSCVLSRINEFGTAVNISVRGSLTPGYDTTSTELSNYQIEEGAFWGNVFTSVGTMVGNSCNGVDQAHDDTYGDLPLRQCAQWDGVAGSNKSPCGFNYAGLCSDNCTSHGAPYTGCSFLGGGAVAQVATTFLFGTPH